MTDFTDLKLAQPILRAIKDEGYTIPTPIQNGSIPSLMMGRDLLGVAQTGTGKTAAFALPLLHRLADRGARPQGRRPLALILAPTRELAGQIGDSLKSYGRHLHLRTAVVFGGTSIRPQISALAQGVHVLVATPGRLLDLMNQGHARLDGVEVFILDEADRMLDMGFIRDVKKISAAVPAKRQTVLFSATMPKSVQSLADELLDDPIRVETSPTATTVERIEQRVLFVAKDKKRALLEDLLADKGMERVLIFTRTKHGADRVTRHLLQAGIKAEAIHGNKAQNARQRALSGFRSGRVRALVATDIAARGIDVDGVTHVINFELPNDPESYVHRIGRTARAGAEGVAISFCDSDERAYLRDIEKTIRQSVPVISGHAHEAFHGKASAANDSAPATGHAQPKKHHRGQGPNSGPKSGSKPGSGPQQGRDPRHQQPRGQRQRRRARKAA